MIPLKFGKQIRLIGMVAKRVKLNTSHLHAYGITQGALLLHCALYWLKPQMEKTLLKHFSVQTLS